MDSSEKVYQRAMQVELQARGLTVDLESKIKVVYKGVIVGDYQPISSSIKTSSSN